MDKDMQALVHYRMEQADEAMTNALMSLEHQSYRAAINRAYYAMFYAVLALLSLSGEGTSKHSGAIAMFDREFVKNGIFDKKFSKWLHDVFHQRQVSDYKEMVQVTQAEASKAAEEARVFVERVKLYLAEKIG